jgi:rod shape-determining protein MreD
LLLLLLAAPLGLPGQPELQQAAALGNVFFWSLFRPGSMTPPMVFLLGLLVLLIAHGLALRWRRALTRQGFLIVWLAFLGIAAAAAAMSWALVSLLTLTLLPVGPALFQAGLSAGCYPLLATLLVRAHRNLADPEQA